MADNMNRNEESCSLRSLSPLKIRSNKAKALLLVPVTFLFGQKPHFHKLDTEYSFLCDFPFIKIPSAKTVLLYTGGGERRPDGISYDH